MRKPSSPPPAAQPAEPAWAAAFQRSPCPVTNMLDILGDKWTLLVVRDLMFGKRTFGEFLESPEGIPTNILAERLKRLERAGLVSKTPYQQRPVRYAYALTEKGSDLRPVLRAIARWGNKHIPGTWVPGKDVSLPQTDGSKA